MRRSCGSTSGSCWCARAELALADGQPGVALAITGKLIAATRNATDGATSRIPRVTACAVRPWRR